MNLLNGESVGVALPVVWGLDGAAALFDGQVTVEAASEGLGFGLPRCGNHDAVAGQCRTERPDMLAFAALELSIGAIAQPILPAADIDVVQLAIDDVFRQFQHPKTNCLAIGIGEALYDVVSAALGVNCQEGFAGIEGLLQREIAACFEEAFAVSFAGGLARGTRFRYSCHCFHSNSVKAMGKGVCSTACPFSFRLNLSGDGLIFLFH